MLCTFENNFQGVIPWFSRILVREGKTWRTRELMYWEERPLITLAMKWAFIALTAEGKCFTVYQIYQQVNPRDGSLNVNKFHGVFTLAVSGTVTGTGTWIRKNGLYGFKKNLSHCTWTGTGKNGLCTHFSGPETFRWCILKIFQWLSAVQSWPHTASVNGFCIIWVPVLVLVPVPETARVNTPSGVKYLVRESSRIADNIVWT